MQTVCDACFACASCSIHCIPWHVNQCWLMWMQFPTIRHARDLAEFRKSTDIKLVPPAPCLQHIGTSLMLTPSAPEVSVVYCLMDEFPILSACFPRVRLVCCRKLSPRTSSLRKPNTLWLHLSLGIAAFGSISSCDRFAYGTKSRPSTPITHVASWKHWIRMWLRKCLGCVCREREREGVCSDEEERESVRGQIGNQYATESEEARDNRDHQVPGSNALSMQVSACVLRLLCCRLWQFITECWRLGKPVFAHLRKSWPSRRISKSRSVGLSS